MPPRRPRHVDEAAMNDVDMLRRDNADLRRQVEILTQRLDAINPERDDATTVTEDNPWFHRNPSPERRDRRWEIGFKVDIPDFNGGLKAEEFIDWLSQVEEILDFKEVPDDRRVPLVAIRLRGRAQAWWQQLKQTRVRTGKEKISSWEKFKKHI